MAGAKKKTGSVFLAAMPLIVGILITPLALQAASVLVLSGQSGLTMLFPWAQIVKAAILHIPEDVQISTSQLLMYLQFPVYGLVMVKLRERPLMMSLGAVALLHVAGAIAAVILAHMSNPSLRFV
ncbi:MAG TPA: hypothetical protein VMD58_08825 [Acidobacteriaceae bacterium]|nr:hypothetical protein [Acidobacteriaceae bacterium]